MIRFDFHRGQIAKATKKLKLGGKRRNAGFQRCRVAMRNDATVCCPLSCQVVMWALYVASRKKQLNHCVNRVKLGVTAKSVGEIRGKYSNYSSLRRSIHSREIPSLNEWAVFLNNKRVLMGPVYNWLKTVAGLTNGKSDTQQWNQYSKLD